MGDSVKKYFETERDYKEWVEQRWTKTTTANIKTDSVVENVIELFKDRSAVGIDKYNTTLEDSTEGFGAFLNHLQQELMDATLYIEKLKRLNN